MRTNKKIKFSPREKADLFKAWAILSLAFAILLSDNYFSIDFVVNILIAGLTVGVGFVFHELGHKFVAQKYGCFAEFRADYSMLVIALMSSFFGFLFAAPGAVVIAGHTTKERYGKISLAGPLMSITVAILFFALALFPMGSLVQTISFYGFRINAFLGLFNLIPFGPFDGRTVLNWSKGVYHIMPKTPVF